MTRSRSTLPKMGNNGGTAFVRINGKRIYLGKFGTPEANASYARHIAEWTAGGTVLEKSSPSSGSCAYSLCPFSDKAIEFDARQKIAHTGVTTVDSLATAFLEHVQTCGRSHYYSLRSAVRVLLQLYSGTPVDSFTPKCLTALQRQFTQQADKNGKPYSRQYCNALVNYIRWMFRWGVAQELVSSTTADALKYVSALRRGHTEAPETEPLGKTLSHAVVNATLPYLSPTVAAMVQVQRLAGMQPNEICRMRVGDIDRSQGDGLWIYTPPKPTRRDSAKTISVKTILLDKPAQALILPYLEGKSLEQAVFSPKTALLEKKVKDAERRKTKLYPSQIHRAAQRAENPQRQVREHYTLLAYSSAIRRAIAMGNRSLPDEQKIPRWVPLQLAHMTKSTIEEPATVPPVTESKESQPFPSGLFKIGNDSGSAFVQISGTRIDLGKFGTPESYENYARCIAEWAVSGGTPVQSPPPVGGITIGSLITMFLEDAKNIACRHHSTFRIAAKVLLQLYSDRTVDSFSRQDLAAVQHQCTQQIGKNGNRYSRQYCNDLINRIKKMFRWGVVQGFVSPNTTHALKYVPALQFGRTDAPESETTKPRREDVFVPVPSDVVDTTLPHLLPTVAAMVQVQRLAVMQPLEVCRMRVGDIDRSRNDGTWVYSPFPRTGRVRSSIPLGRQEQALILPYLEGKLPEQAVFSPKTALSEKKEKDANRRTRQPCSWKEKRAAQRAENPQTKVREHYDPGTYSQAIRVAIKRTNRRLPSDQQIPHWSPCQLLYVTEPARKDGKNPNTTSKKLQPMTSALLMRKSND